MLSKISDINISLPNLKGDGHPKYKKPKYQSVRGGVNPKGRNRAAAKNRRRS